MAVNVRASSKGFTMLELALAVALSAVLLTAFFSASQALMKGLLMAADGMRGPAEAAAAMDQITYDLEQAISFTSSTSYAISFQTPGGNIAYRLFANDSASQDVVLERAFNGASRSIGPRRMIANFNPYGSTFIIGGAPTTAPVVLFNCNPAVSTPASGPWVDMFLVLQPNQTAPINYIRTKALCVTMRSW